MGKLLNTVNKHTTVHASLPECKNFKNASLSLQIALKAELNS